jgi:hypothetical protein
MRERLHGRGDGIRDVVQFQIEKNFVPAIGDPVDESRTVTREELQPDLHPAHLMFDAIEYRERLLFIGDVEGENQITFHEGVLRNRRGAKHDKTGH